MFNIIEDYGKCRPPSRKIFQHWKIMGNHGLFHDNISDQDLHSAEQTWAKIVKSTKKHTPVPMWHWQMRSAEHGSLGTDTNTWGHRFLFYVDKKIEKECMFLILKFIRIFLPVSGQFQINLKIRNFRTPGRLEVSLPAQWQTSYESGKLLQTYRQWQSTLMKNYERIV